MKQARIEWQGARYDVQVDDRDQFASLMAPCFKQATFAGCLPPTERCSALV